MKRSQRLKPVLGVAQREQDTLARLAGDQFGLILLSEQDSARITAFAETIRLSREACPGMGIEVLIPDFNGEEAPLREVMAAARAYKPEARIEGVLVQEMVRGGIETILGVTNDPLFGPAVMFGLGGIFAEVMKDVSFRMAPVTPSVARDMIDEIKGSAVLKGARGAAPPRSAGSDRDPGSRTAPC